MPKGTPMKSVLAPVCMCSALVLLTATVCAGASTGRMSGVWASEGYGRVLEITESQINTFDVTEISCVLRGSQPLRDFHRRINRINLSEDEQFSYYDEGGITRYNFTRLNGLPDACIEAKAAEPILDPEYNFEVFWRSFDENYAFFDTHDVDWQAVYQQYRPRVNANTSNDSLYDILTEMISLLDDRHVSLEGDDYPRRYSGHPGTLQKLLQKELPAGQHANRDAVIAIARSVVAEHYLRSSIRDAIGGQFTWGWAAEGIGYFSVDAMAGYIDDDEASLRDSLRLVDQTMDQVIRDLKDAKGIIVDARWNGGGEDSNALHIAGHFTNQQLLAFTKRAWKGDGLTPEQEVFIPSHAVESYAGPVVYLCSSDTLSAAEIFSMAMMAMPNVTSLGEPTVGALSDTHSVYLPNGWLLRLSNEVYKAIDGKVYEGLGIPVDINLPPPEDSTLESYIRLGTDEAIALLQREPGND